MHRSLGVVATLVALIAGCDEGSAAPAVTLEMRDDQCTRPACFCDIELPECQQHLFEVTAELRGDEAGELPVIRSLGVDVVRAELLEMLAADGLLEPTPWDAPLQMLKLVPADQTIAETLVDDLLVGVAAFYSWDTGEVTIIEGNTPDDNTIGSTVLSHEFVHALQDRDQGLQALRDMWVESTDTSTALRHAFEGEADVLSTIVLILASGGRDEDDFPWDDYYDAFLDAMLQAIGDTASPFLSAPYNLPYPQGGRVVHAIRRDGGQAAVEQLYVDGPGGAVDWIGEQAPAGRSTLVREPTCVPVLPGGERSALDADSLGALGLFGLLMGQGMAGFDALELSAALRADVIVVLGDASAPTAADTASVEWRMEFATAGDALEVQRALRSPSIGVRTEGEALRMWAAGTDVDLDALATRDGCGDPGALADALGDSEVRRPKDALDRMRRLTASPSRHAILPD